MVGILEIQQFLEFLETFPRNFCAVCHCFKFFKVLVDWKAPKYSHYKGVCTSRDCMLVCCLWVLLGQLYIEAFVDRGLTRQFYHSSYRIIYYSRGNLVWDTNMTTIALFWDIYNANVVSCEQGWHSGEGACVPPMWPGFKSQRQCHMWVEFVVGSLHCSERFFSGY